MRFSLCAVALVLSLLCFESRLSFAESNGAASVTGGGTFIVGNNLQGHFSFNAVTHRDGTVTGHMSLRDPEDAPDQDVDGTGELGLQGLSDGVDLTADVDSINVNGTRAALSGVITRASVPRYVGLRIIITVQDNGEGNPEPDKITWGFYQRVNRRLVADEENPDAGAFPVGEKILATDFENPEAGAFLVGESDLDGHSFPLTSYVLTDIDGGTVQVHEDRSR
jgi:hypothetical protein